MSTFPLPLGFETVSLPESECIPSSPLRTAMLRFPMQPYWSMSEGGTKTVSNSLTVFPLTFTPRFRTCIVSTVFFIGWWKPPCRDDAKLVLVSCPISTASCTFTLVSETTCPFTMLYTMYSESDWCVSGCVSGCERFRSSVKIRSLSSRSSSRISLPSSSLPLQGENKHRSTSSRRRLVHGWSICPSVPRLVSPV